MTSIALMLGLNHADLNSANLIPTLINFFWTFIDFSCSWFYRREFRFY